jgi:hypothetical protein
MNRCREFLVVLSLCAGASILWSQESKRGPEVVLEEYHDTSEPVSAYLSPTELRPASPPKIQPLRRRSMPAGGEPQDEAVQTAVTSALSATVGLNFDGMSEAANGNLGSVPPDPNLAVGATQVVEVINTAFQVFAKATGTSLFGPMQISSIFTGVPGLCGQGTASSFTDPIVLYDQLAGRWLISIVALNATATQGNECVAVSTSSDATGSYNRYGFAVGAQHVNDYPKLGIWPDAYYASYNIFTPSSFLTSLACAYDRAPMLAGTAAKAVCFSAPAEFSFLPSNLDGSVLPPTGEPNFYLDLAGSTALHMCRFHADFVTPSNSTFTGPIIIPVTAYTQACSATGTCIPQAGTTQQLDSLGDRLMYRLAYRNFTSHESLVVNHSVQTNTAASGVRWYEIRGPNGTPVVFQQSTFAAGSFSCWMGSMAMDKVGDIGLGFSVSSSAIHPAIAFIGRAPTDALNIMEPPVVIFAGAGSQTAGTVNGGNRWGDYSGMAVDPVDDCTFWYVNEYLQVNGLFNFHTRIASVKFPGCQ